MPSLMRPNAGTVTLVNTQSKECLEHFLSAWLSPLCRSFTLHESQETVKGFRLIPVVLPPKCLISQGSCCCLESTQQLVSVNVTKVLHQDNSNYPTPLLLSRSACSLT